MPGEQYLETARYAVATSLQPSADEATPDHVLNGRLATAQVVPESLEIKTYPSPSKSKSSVVTTAIRLDPSTEEAKARQSKPLGPICRASHGCPGEIGGCAGQRPGLSKCGMTHGKQAAAPHHHKNQIFMKFHSAAFGMTALEPNPKILSIDSSSNNRQSTAGS